MHECKFDPEEVKKGVQEYTQKVANAKDDLERAEAQIGLEVHSALQAALGVSAWAFVNVDSASCSIVSQMLVIFDVYGHRAAAPSSA